MISATYFQAATYLLGVCLFSISFLVFLNASISFVITDILHQLHRVGDTVGTLGFADEVVALVACPLWGVLSDRIGVRWVCVLGYAIIGVSLALLVQVKNLYPQLLLARMLFSLGASAATTMVTAILPSMVSRSHQQLLADPAAEAPGSPSLSSEITVTPSRFASRSSPPENKSIKSSIASPNRLAGLVGMFTGIGALVALGVFLPLPVHLQDRGFAADRALSVSYDIVGIVAVMISILCFFGLRSLSGEQNKSLRRLVLRSKIWKPADEGDAHLVSYWQLFVSSALLGIRRSTIGLAYLGGFVARASSVAISLFIPLYVNAYFQASGRCDIDDVTKVKLECRDAYILAAKLAGLSQLIALISAPFFGYLADWDHRFHVPLLISALSGVIGYSCFAGLTSPLTSGPEGSPIIYAFVSLLGISQIGAIVCSLGLLGRGLTNDEIHATDECGSGHSASRDHLHHSRGSHDQLHGYDGEASFSDPRSSELNDNSAENTTLLGGHGGPLESFVHLKGSVAGVYSLMGGAGILLLTKLGGYLFDSWSVSAPFYMMALFNGLLLVGCLLSTLLPRQPR